MSAMNLRRLRIGLRLGLGFGLVLLLLAVAIAAAIVLSSQQRSSAMAALLTAGAKERLASDMQVSLLESAVAMRNVALESEVAAFQKQADKARTERKRYGVARAQFEKLGQSEAERKILAEAANLDKAVEQPFFQAVSLAQAMSVDDATKVIASQVDPLQQKQIALINQLQTLQEVASKEVAQQSEAAGHRLSLLLLGIGALALGLGAGISLLYTRSITRPLADAVTMAERVRGGNLTPLAVNTHGADEPAFLQATLQLMTEQLRGLVTGVRDTADEVTRAALGISQDHDQLSSRTETQAGNLEETAATMEQLTATVKITSDSAQTAHGLAVDANAVASNGQSVMQRVVETMASIHRGSGRIAEINSVIDGIAFQTNILALNAAVEAARAGEQGRGFAVVASEVRHLAQRSATAAKEIKQLIDESVAQAASGAQLVEQAGKTMVNIVASVGRVQDVVEGISHSSREQSEGIAQINEAISSIDSVTQQNASLVESSAATVTHLRERADRLSKAVSVFVV